MKTKSFAGQFVRFAVVPVLAVAVGVGTGVAQGHSDEHGNGNAYGHYKHDKDHGNKHDDWRFREQDRQHFQPYYQKDVNHWRGNPHNRAMFVRGQRVSTSYHFQPVPRAYYAEVPPPPPGYQYGYYQGYVVAYDPTTRVVADVLDLVSVAVNH